MSLTFRFASLKLMDESMEVFLKVPNSFIVKLVTDPGQEVIHVDLDCLEADKKFIFKLTQLEDFYRSGDNSVVLKSSPTESAVITFSKKEDATDFSRNVLQYLKAAALDPRRNAQYFQHYGKLLQQQKMLQDSVRTLTYQRAMLQNNADFTDKVVIDMGAGSGILSFFAVQAGARKVYAVEASSMAVHCQQLVQANNLEDKIQVVVGKVEEVDIPEKVDMIISEPMGHMLFNERMLESYVHAKKWLKPNGKMFPTKGVLQYAPFSDEKLYAERCNLSMFWSQEHFCGVNISSLKEASIDENFRQPIKGPLNVDSLMAKSASYSVNFQAIEESALLMMKIPFTFKMNRSGIVHGLGFWFDVSFDGSQETIWLSTAPSEPMTHWHQVRLLLKQPIFCKVEQEMTGHILMKVNGRRSYDIDLELEVTGTQLKYSSSFDMGNVVFNNKLPQEIPGCSSCNPTDAYMDGTKRPSCKPMWRNEEVLATVF